MIVWDGSLLDPSGYGSCAREYVRALDANRDDVHVKIQRYYSGDYNDYMSDGNYFKKLQYSMPDSDAVYIEHKTPGALNTLHHKRDIGYTVWETNRIPEQFVSSCNAKDEIWTPSEYSKNSLLTAGVTSPIKIIPHIINSGKFSTVKPSSEKVIFLFNGEFTYRKGVDVLLKSFMKAFTDKDNVTLFIKTYLLDNTPFKYVANFIKDMKAEVNPDSCPNIRVMNSVIKDADIPKLYNAAHIFVSATRGEGFGIPIAEAMASGMKVIVPSIGGHREFCTTSNSNLISSRVVDIDGDKLEPTRKIYRGQKWVEPNEDSLITELRKAYRGFNREINVKAVEDIKKFSATNIYNMIEGRL